MARRVAPKATDNSDNLLRKSDRHPSRRTGETGYRPIDGVRFASSMMEIVSSLMPARINAAWDGRARPEDASSAGTSLDLARRPWYLRLMIRSVRIANRKHARLCWAVEGVVR
jgi:hypothetical protein